MTHYICKGGCEGVSQTEGTCQATTCASHGKPLEPCNCSDGKHSKPLTEESDESQEESDDATK